MIGEAPASHWQLVQTGLFKMRRYSDPVFLNVMNYFGCELAGEQMDALTILIAVGFFS